MFNLYVNAELTTRELVNSILTERWYSRRPDNYTCMLSDAVYFNVVWFPNEKKSVVCFTSFLLSLSLSTSLSHFCQLSLVESAVSQKREESLSWKLPIFVWPGKDERKAVTSQLMVYEIFWLHRCLIKISCLHALLKLWKSKLSMFEQGKTCHSCDVGKCSPHKRASPGRLWSESFEAISVLE